jgi:putative copper export protein
MQIKILILLHLIGACIWVGGHLVLCISVLPKALRENKPEVIRIYEERFERIGIPALFLQIVTGIWMAQLYIGIENFFSFENTMYAHISVKLILLIATILLAIHARFFIIPKLSADNLSYLALHIVAITIVALGLLFTGLNFRLNII